jgi:hypothetical protein
MTARTVRDQPRPVSFADIGWVSWSLGTGSATGGIGA